MIKNFTLLFILIFSNGFTENLVPNSSFEERFCCPIGYNSSSDTIDCLNNWQIPKSKLINCAGPGTSDILTYAIEQEEKIRELERQFSK